MVQTTRAQTASVLVVDDDSFSQAILRKRLEEMGLADIRLADNGEQAVQLLETLPAAPDFLICDIFMPDMDGIEFIAKLATRSYQGGLILVSGGDPSMLEVASEIANLRGLRVLGSLGKPVALHALRQLMGLAPD